MKQAMCIAAASVLVASCGMADTKPAPVAAAKAVCEPPPAALVKKDLKEGDGRTAIPLATAMVFYTGWVYDPCAPDHKGAQFDSNAGKQVPFGFRIGTGRVIKGWDEGLAGMKEGGKRVLVIPANMAYGEKEVAGKIPANSALVFEVELMQLAGPNLPPPSASPPRQ